MFPVSLNLRGRRCLVVGGGAVALRKVRNLQKCGAMVYVVTPNPGTELREMVLLGSISLAERQFQASDVKGCFLVFAATNDEAVNQQISDLCQQSCILVNVVDDPEKCSFFVPSILHRGDLTISVSTAGKSPLLARQLRLKLENLIGPEYQDYIEILGEARTMVKANFIDEAYRRQVFESVLKVEVLPLLEQGKKGEAKERIFQCIYSWLE